MKIIDQIVLAIFAGIIATAVANFFGYLSKMIYPPAIIMPEIAVETWVNASQIQTVPGMVFGNLCSFLVGCLHALILVLVLNWSGWRFFWLKSFLVTAIGWFLATIWVLRGLHLQPEALNNIYVGIVFFAAHVVYLTVSAVLIAKYGVAKGPRGDNPVH